MAKISLPSFLFSSRLRCLGPFRCLRSHHINLDQWARRGVGVLKLAGKEAGGGVFFRAAPTILWGVNHRNRHEYLFLYCSKKNNFPKKESGRFLLRFFRTELLALMQRFSFQWYSFGSTWERYETLYCLCLLGLWFLVFTRFTQSILAPPCVLSGLPLNPTATVSLM